MNQGSDSFGIRAGLSVGNPFRWSKLSLAFAKLSESIKMIVKTPTRILFTPYLVPLWIQSPYLVLVNKVYSLTCGFKTLGSRGWVVSSYIPVSVAMFRMLNLITLD